MPRQRHYEYHREFKKQTPGMKAMISAGEKPGSGVIKALAMKKKKPKAPVKKKKLNIFQKAKKRLKKVFGKKGY
ncbi:hypothetical protein LCGC14_0946740 [marine sediment metagenome]|uniref:Uncharacterized protein n=1 Tax=marine sediment metagenome TaxID=412755 RepID=A0A0F9NN84_9ZZZZ